MTPDLTVVVTTFRRPKLLARCLDTLLKAGCSNIVVSAMGLEPETLEVLNRYAQTPGVSFFATALHSDLGVNELWLRGVYYATTKYVLLLHDDDFLDGSFSKAYNEIMHPALESGCGFANWRGLCVMDDLSYQVCDHLPRQSTRVLGTLVVKEYLMSSPFPMSPVISVFRRPDVIRTLKEVSDKFQDYQFYSRPTMVLGNDMMLYLRACERHSSFLYVDEILSFYGGWPGSETQVAMSNGSEKWVSSWDKAKAYAMENRGLSYSPSPRLLSIFPEYPVADPEERRRLDFAASTWAPIHEAGQVMPIVISNEMLTRSAKTELGDPKSMAFLRDFFDHSLEYAQPEDIVFYRNTDTCVIPDGPRIIRERFEQNPNLRAAFAWRHNFYTKIEMPLWSVRHGFQDGGADLFAFRPSWWRDFRDAMPDMVMGYEAWDFVLRTMIAETEAGRPHILDGLIYHEFHEPYWRAFENRTQNPGQLMNVKLALNFFRSRNMPDQIGAGDPLVPRGYRRK